MVIRAIYRSPNGNGKEFLNYLQEKLSEDRMHQQRRVIMGDLYIHIDVLNNHGDARKFNISCKQQDLCK